MLSLTAFPDSFDALVIGASRGIGLEFTRQLLSAGKVGRVFAVSRTSQSADGLLALKEGFGDRLNLLNADVSDESSLEVAASVLRDQDASLGLIIYTSGLLHNSDGVFPERKLTEVSLEGLRAGFEVNAFGMVLCAKHFHKFLPRKQHCVMAHLSARVGSISDNRLGGWYTYRASKSAQNMLTRNLAIELGRRNKQLVCVALHPGTVDTDLSSPFQKNVPEEKLFSTEKSVRKLLQVIEDLRPEDNGRFFAYDGSPIPW
jgi:NAD(P)-dependent dehydrogenase (short-subunit alcohol dehydrogenase family)